METVFEQTIHHQEDESSSSTESVVSFVSAVSDQEPAKDLHSILRQKRNRSPSVASSDEDTDKEFNLPVGPTNFIDLHGQINRPITKSPLLMSCYMTHMTQLQCSYWTAEPPQPNNKKPQSLEPDPEATLTPGQSLEQDHVVSGIPHYAYTKEGFTPNLMVNKKEPKTPPGFHSPGTLPNTTARHFFPDTATDDFSPGNFDLLLALWIT